MTDIRQEHRDRFYKLISNIENLSDRDVSVLVASYVEDYLRNLIVSIAKQHPELVEDLLFRRLNTLRGKISVFENSDISSIAGLSSDLVNDLHLIRRIRNDFAHKAEDLSFSDNDISQRCEALQTPSQGSDPDDPRERFTTSAVRILVELVIVLKEKQAG